MMIQVSAETVDYVRSSLFIRGLLARIVRIEGETWAVSDPWPGIHMRIPLTEGGVERPRREIIADIRHMIDVYRHGGIDVR